MEAMIALVMGQVQEVKEFKQARVIGLDQNAERICHNKIHLNNSYYVYSLYDPQSIFFCVLMFTLIITLLRRFVTFVLQKKRKRDYVLWSKTYYKLVQTAHLTLTLWLQIHSSLHGKHGILYKALRDSSFAFIQGPVMRATFTISHISQDQEVHGMHVEQFFLLQ